MTANQPECFIFVNPVSGSYDRGRIDYSVERLQQAGYRPRLCGLESPERSEGVFEDINSSGGRPLVIVAAGDGTFNAVVNRLVPGQATLAVLPLGTSNVLAAELGIGSLEEGLERILVGQVRSLTAGLMEYEGGQRRFVLMAGFGFDGAVVRDVSLGWKRLLKQGAYGLSALRNSLVWDRRGIEVHMAGRTIACHGVVLCNAARYGGKFVLAREASLFSPRLVAVCILNSSRTSYLRLASDLARGTVGENPDLLCLAVETCEISGCTPVQVDGDFIGYSPARVSTLPAFANLIV